MDDVKAYRAKALSAAREASAFLAQLGITAIITGSLARGRFTIHSDIDFLVTECPKELKYRIDGKLEIILSDIPFDVIYVDDLDDTRLARFMQGALPASQITDEPLSSVAIDHSWEIIQENLETAKDHYRNINKLSDIDKLEDGNRKKWIIRHALTYVIKDGYFLIERSLIRIQKMFDEDPLSDHELLASASSPTKTRPAIISDETRELAKAIIEFRDSESRSRDFDPSELTLVAENAQRLLERVIEDMNKFTSELAAYPPAS